MTKPQNLKTRIFLDSGIPEETKEAVALLGFLDGQTTNPSLITKHPSFIACKTKGEKCTEEDAWRYYKEIVTEISSLIGHGSISIEVYADRTTKAKEMIAKGLELNTWISHAHIKLPITHEGLLAAEGLVAQGIRVNMTLCFSQEQAAAVYAATKGAKKGDVFLSPFVGRLDDRGENGIGFVENILRMFKEGDGHVETLAASVRTFDHFQESLRLGADIVTSPIKILKEWQGSGLTIPGASYEYDSKELTTVPYREFDLGKDWREFDITHELTDNGLDRFANDWKALFQ